MTLLVCRVTMANKLSKEVNTAIIDMDKMRIGDKFRAPIYPSVRERKLEEGTIVYIQIKAVLRGKKCISRRREQ